MKLLIVVLSAFMIVADAHQLQAQPSSRKYDFPVRPGTQRWNELTSVAQRREACQIPEVLLKNISTADLVQTCLDYPYLPDMFLFNKVQRGFNTVLRDFNGLRELMSRRDAPPLLFAGYKALSPDEFDRKWNLVEKGRYAIRLMSIEILLAQLAARGLFAESEARALIGECLGKADKKSSTPQLYSRYDLVPTALVAGRIMQTEGFAIFNDHVSHDPEMQVFLRDASMQNDRVVTEILGYARQKNSEK